MIASKNIKIFKASNFNYTPFNDFNLGDLDYLKSKRIEIVTKSSEADVIISQNFKYLKKHFWKFILGKKFLVWTLEPRFDTHFVKFKKYFFGLFKCHFMNIYTEDIFVTNISIHCKIINKKLELIEKEKVNLKSRKIIALMSYYQGINTPKLIRNSVNIDLIALRSIIAIEGSKLGLIDVYGKGWPEGISKENSREGAWSSRKKELLNPYNFNLCFENTATYNYMTEKIWDSIENYCLPIYYAKNTNVYELFPEDSFIDYTKFNTPEELFNFVANISDEEFSERINKCIKVYNSISTQGQELVKSERKKTLDKIFEKLELLTIR